MDASLSSKVASHQPISLAKKLKIIEAVENAKKSKSAVAEEFSVAKSTVTSIMKNKQKIIDASNTAGFMPDRKRLRLAAHSDIEDALMIWFTQARTLNLLDRLRTEGVEISEELTFEAFVNVDTAVVTTAALSNDDIAAIVQKRQVETDTEEANELDDSPIPPPPPTASEATKSLQVLKRYFESKDPVSGEEAISLISKLEKSLSNDVLYHAHVQTHITDYFPM